ncbi:transcriptional regulator [Levilactobacillus senmaizukei DSM 21775 = NBRC 103853]|uniref:Transcriptional regulator n=1 Tax=Levilactobacillus senmaizukei DSM 21775 = NBRC 103853 TaxID=1423803 RepID=A0A0R2DMJ6_9LACO|nr:TetR/AcrR family transcriptional regulator [Levilactobacillus senmaizukei]KRN01484.1 transcriptional regulator [Levilactobacillus senmaizukei DSM 21775 = NBRC 103853]
MAQNTREKIIQVAETLIMETGKTDVTLADIAGQLGMTHAALYKHFHNKQALWEAVAQAWFNREVLQDITVNDQLPQREQLHQWLWTFVNAKKTAYNTNPQMFALNTRYVDNNPRALRTVLTSAYAEINQIMGYDPATYDQAEAVLAAFAIFTLPNFKDTWNDDDYQERFERQWALITQGV